MQANILLDCHLSLVKDLRSRLLAGQRLDVKLIRNPELSELGKRLQAAEMREHRYTQEYLDVVEALDNFLLVASVLASIANSKSAEDAAMVFKQNPQYRETSLRLSRCINTLTDFTSKTKAFSRNGDEWTVG